MDDGIFVELTCASFDNMHRKLLVGFSNGVVHSYNFNNGFQINTFSTGPPQLWFHANMMPSMMG